MKTQILRETNWKKVREEEYKIAILPWGATEAHNYHLPYGTDTILAEKIASDAAGIANQSGAGCIVLPSIAYGINTGQMEVKLCMNMRPSTQMAIIRDILEVLKSHDINKLVILNAHGGNAFAPLIRELSLDFPQIIISSINWWQVCKPEGYFTEAGDHAGELETSCLQATAPELVLPLKEAGNGEEKKFIIDGFREKWAWTPRRWVYITNDTGVGNPKDATPEKGERFMRDCTEKIAKFLVEFSKNNSERELYER